MYNNKAKKSSNRHNATKRTNKNNTGRMSINTYRKDYPSFEEGILDICNINPKISKMLCIDPFNVNKEDITLSKVISMIIDIATKYTPNYITKENTLWEYKISANSVNVKTNQFISFGWNFKNIKSKDGMVISFYITIHGRSDKEIEDLLNNGFKSLDDFKKQQIAKKNAAKSSDDKEEVKKEETPVQETEVDVKEETSEPVENKVEESADESAEENTSDVIDPDDAAE